MVKVLKFSAAWCRPCRMLSPIFDQIKKEIPGVNYIDINVDTQPKLVQVYSVTGVPLVVIEKDGVITDAIRGVNSKSVYTSAIQKLL
jgi:thioredoxin 1